MGKAPHAGGLLEEHAMPDSDTPRIRVLVADDHPAFRQVTVTLLSRRPNVEIVAVCGDGQDALDRCVELSPDVALVDMHMPRLDGVELIRRARLLAPGVGMIVLSGTAESPDVEAAFDAGAAGYLVKLANFDELIRGIETVAAGQRYLSPAVPPPASGFAG